ncbi:MAG: DUF6440 family protein [Candidatus Enterenecus sp.]
MAKEKRFEVVQEHGGGFGPYCQVLLDTATGVQYLFVQNGNAGGLTPLLDREGKPMLWNV